MLWMSSQCVCLSTGLCLNLYWDCAGDKEPAFIGSKQWVGAIELSYVLDSLLGVSSKIITIAKGWELPDKAREIAHHFDTQGGYMWQADLCT
jgi:hypothetical protein